MELTTAKQRELTELTPSGPKETMTTNKQTNELSASEQRETIMMDLETRVAMKVTLTTDGVKLNKQR